MALIHFRFTEGSVGDRVYCTIDGARYLTVRDGDYATVKEGHHVISFESNGIKYNVQEYIAQTQCIEITLVLSYQGIEGKPMYSMQNLDEVTVAEISQMVEEKERAHDEKITNTINKVKRFAGLVMGGFISLAGLGVCAFGLLGGGFVPAVAGGICVLIGALILIARSRIKIK